MGEIADMMLEGTMCQECGEFIDDGEEGPGYPRLCAGCAGRQKPQSRATASRKQFECLECHKRFRKEVGLRDHLRDVHGAKL